MAPELAVGITRTSPPIFDACSGVKPKSVGFTDAGGAFDCQIGSPGSPADFRLPRESSVHSKHPDRTHRQTTRTPNNAFLKPALSITSRTFNKSKPPSFSYD